MTQTYTIAELVARLRNNTYTTRDVVRAADTITNLCEDVDRLEFEVGQHLDSLTHEQREQIVFGGSVEPRPWYDDLGNRGVVTTLLAVGVVMASAGAGMLLAYLMNKGIL